MDDKEAFEVVDAHLDSQIISQDQAEALANWLRNNPEHADRAFQRVFLHTFLRQRLQHTGLPGESIVALDDEAEVESVMLQSEAAAALGPPKSGRKRRVLDLKRILAFCILLVCLLGAAGFAFRNLFLPNNRTAGLWVYEGFDYPPTFPPPPVGDGNKWPTSGGVQGLDGGAGWREPWHEAASKVSILVADVQSNAWRPTDMRKFGLLGYADSRGSILKSTGIQLRSAAGPLSKTIRPFALSAFPSTMTEQKGIGSDGSIVWLSFLAQSFDGRGLGTFAYMQLGTDSAGFRLGKLSSVPSGNWAASGILDGAELNMRWSDFPSGQAVFLVTRITFRPGGEEADVWINPKLNPEPLAAAATLHVPLPDFRFDQISICSRYTTDFDEIRIGGSFRDVAPTR